MLPIIGTVVGIIGNVVEKYFENKEEATRFKNEVMAELVKQSDKLQQLQAEIVREEIKGQSWVQRAWRPLLMLTIVFIIFNNYVIHPYAEALLGKSIKLNLPPELWNLLLIGLGGYIGHSIGQRQATLKSVLKGGFGNGS